MQPICQTCGDEYPEDRLRIGYRYCLMCGDDMARQERRSWCVSIPYSKGAYQLITNRTDLLETNPKRLNRS